MLGRLRQEDPAPLIGQLQPGMRRQALRVMAGSCVQIPRDGALQPVASTLLASANLEGHDELGSCVDVAAAAGGSAGAANGQLLPADDPRALLQLETLVSNWLVRTAELIGAELEPVVTGRSYVVICSGIACWPPGNWIVCATSSTKLRWSEWIERPIGYKVIAPCFNCVTDGLNRWC